jgi:hypothetical protein
MTGHVVKSNHVLQHTHCLVEWAETIIGGVAETQQWSTWYVRKRLVCQEAPGMSGSVWYVRKHLVCQEAPGMSGSVCYTPSISTCQPWYLFPNINMKHILPQTLPWRCRENVGQVMSG